MGGLMVLGGIVVNVTVHWVYGTEDGSADSFNTMAGRVEGGFLRDDDVLA